MRHKIYKSKDGNFTPFFPLNVKIYVDARAFAIALTDEQYNAGGEAFDFKKLTQKKAFSILSQRLKLHGVEGSYFGESDDVLGEGAEEYNIYYDQVMEWVLNKFPDLSAE